jgi:transketolase subunit A (EC 2.2.1.1)
MRQTVCVETQPGGLTPLDDRGRKLRRDVVEIFEHSRRGHVGSTFSLIEIVRVLYDDILRIDPRNPRDPKRDRFILSKGHGCLALYVVLADKGFFPAGELCRFCAYDGILGGHPEAGKVPGVEASTGALGHGLSIGVGMAVSARMDKRDSRVYVAMGDGEINEGSVWEAALSAGNRGLDNLWAIVDYNKQQSYDTTFEVQNLEPLADKWRAFGFAVTEVDGHDLRALREAFKKPLEPSKPTCVICHTVKGKGYVPSENNLAWHHKSKFTDEDMAGLRAAFPLKEGA